MKIYNVLNGRIVSDGAQHREAGSWTIPCTTASDIGLALKCGYAAEPRSLRDDVASLMTIGREASWIGDDHLRAIAERTGSPIRYLRDYIDRTNAWLAGIDRYVERFGELDEAGNLRRGAICYQRGLLTTLVLAGDHISMAPLQMAHLVLAGTRGLIKGSSAEPLSAFLFMRALLEQGVGRRLQLVYLDSSSADDVGHLRLAIGKTQQSIVFGEDHTIASIYGAMSSAPHHKVIAYWSGRSGAIVYADADVDAAAQAIIHGATEDRGSQCLSTKKVWAPRAIAAELEARLAHHARALRSGDPLDRDTDVTAPAGGRPGAERAAAADDVFYDRDLILARCSSQRSPLLTDEVPYPVVGIRYYDAEDPVALANDSVARTPSGMALVTSIFTTSVASYCAAAPRLRSWKVRHNRATTTWDFHSTHQGMDLWVELMRPREV